MEEFINRLKKIDNTKKLVILFITISFVFIFGITSYNALTDNFENNKTATTLEVEKKSKTEKELVEKNTDKEVEEDNKEEKSNQDENNDSKKNNDSTSENTKKSSTSTKQESNSSSKNINDKNSSSPNNNSSNDKNNNASNSNQIVQPSQPIKETISVHVQVIGMGNTMMSGNLTVEKGANAYSVLKEIASKNGLAISGSQYYVSGIGNLKEKQHGPMSGWMYKVNGTPPNKAAYYYQLENNDSVVWYYVNYE